MSDDRGDQGGKKDYEVGYGRPPKHTQFQSGQSGNPKGPRKGSRALKTDLDEALRATLTITVGGKKRRGTTQALSMYALAIKSATGDLRAAKLLADLVLTVFGPGDRGGPQARLSKQDEELLDRLLERFGPSDGEQIRASDSAPAQTPDSKDDARPEGEGNDGD